MNTDKIYAEQLASEYAPKNTSKVLALKKLDRKVKAPSKAFGWIFGIIGVLVLGVGMCFSLQVIGSGTTMFILGLILGIIGIIMICINYPICKKILENRREKYAAEIMLLANKITD